MAVFDGHVVLVVQGGVDICIKLWTECSLVIDMFLIIEEFGQRVVLAG